VDRPWKERARDSMQRIMLSRVERDADLEVRVEALNWVPEESESEERENLSLLRRREGPISYVLYVVGEGVDREWIERQALRR